MADSSLHILHVEDDITDAVILADLLGEEFGGHRYHITHVDQLKTALNRLDSESFDAILLDLNMGDVNGVDNVSAVRLQAPKTPIVVMTGVDSERVALRSIDQGAQEFLVKGHCDGKAVGYAIQASIRRLAHERVLYHKANYDRLTGLCTQPLFEEHLAKAVARNARHQSGQALLYIDVADLKQINETHGHDIGDAMLCEIANRLKNLLRNSDIITRFPGDEFAVLLDNNSRDFRAHAMQAATRITQAMHLPLTVNDDTVPIAVHIGVAFNNVNSHGFNRWLDGAKQAAHIAKQAGDNQFRIATSTDLFDLQKQVFSGTH